MVLNAYYFRAHVYTLVPRQVREDMRWMADVGTDAVTIAVLEQDLEAAPRNLETICREAERAGMTVFAVPARWAGILAGAPRVPSLFSAMNPDTWILNADGSPHLTGVSGVVSSIYHPATLGLFRENLKTLLTEWPIAGLVFDEPRQIVTLDYSAAARERLGPEPTLEKHVDAYAAFFEALGRDARSVKPEVKLSLFTHATLDGYPVERLARIGTLDYFGCDGRPWGQGVSSGGRSFPKVLLPNAKRFLDAARRNSKGGLVLVETHDLPEEMYDQVDLGLPEVLALEPEQLVYCYYPRNLDDPDRLMKIVAKHLAGAAGR